MSLCSGSLFGKDARYCGIFVSWTSGYYPERQGGKSIQDYEPYIIQDEKGAELKEWYAFATYMQSFENGRLPGKYAESGKCEIRKTVEEGGLINFFKSPNKFMRIAVLDIIIFFIVKFIKKRKCRKSV